MHPVVSVGACSIGLELVAFFQDAIGRSEARLHIAELDLTTRAAVVTVIISSMIFIDQRRAWLERLFDIEHCNKFLVVDAYQSGRLIGAPLAVGNDGHHRLAEPTHLVESEHRLIFRSDIDQAQYGVNVVRDILCRNHPRHAWILLCRAYIDP